LVDTIIVGKKNTDNICKEVECGKGKCKAPSNTTFMYECECEDGWKQFDQHLKFLPCITPNCTFDLTCGEAASPAQPKPPPKDNITSFFDRKSLISFFLCFSGPRHIVPVGRRSEHVNISLFPRMRLELETLRHISFTRSPSKLVELQTLGL